MNTPRVPKPIRQRATLAGRLLSRLRRRHAPVEPSDKPSGKPAADMIPDVWQWTPARYRVRSIILLLINAILFFGLGCFAFWIRSGYLAPFLTEDYWQQLWMVFDPTHEQQITLFDFLFFPIPADQVPMMMVVVGLVLASLTAIPILVSMLYRFPYSLIFTAIVGFVAVLPWLALTVTFCCWIARWRSIQFSFRFATALIAISPVGLYYLSATRNASVVEGLPPIELATLHMPWILAMIAACLLMGVVLMIARIVGYRPGAIAPLLAIMFVTPAVLFHTHVGRNELRYRLLEARLLPGPRCVFPNRVDEAALLADAVQRKLRQFPDDVEQSEIDTLAEQVGLAWRFQLATHRAIDSEVMTPLIEEIDRERDLGERQCDLFVREFPDSIYVPNALYLRGRMLDLRLDPIFTRNDGKLLMRYHDDFPREASLDVWSQLHERYPESPTASVALLRHATLEARAGRVPRAIELLRQLQNRFGTDRPGAGAATQPVDQASLFNKKPPYALLGIEPAAVAHEGKRLLDLLENNRLIDLEGGYDYPTLRELLSMDPHHPRYWQNLKDLKEKISASKSSAPKRLEDNIDVLIATTDPSWSRRINQLETLIDAYASDPNADALAEARYELGVAYQVDNRPAEAREIFKTIEQLHSGSWACDAARRRLAAMGQPES